MVSLIRKLNQEDYVLLTKKGRIDSNGVKLRSVLKNLSDDFYEKNSALNIITLAPKLTGLFLPHIYDYSDFVFSVESINSGNEVT